MANLTPTAVNEINSVYRIEKTDVVLGGTGTNQIANKQAQSLVNTCKYLDNKLTNSVNRIDNNIATLNSSINSVSNLANQNKTRLDNLVIFPNGSTQTAFINISNTTVTNSDKALIWVQAYFRIASFELNVTAKITNNGRSIMPDMVIYNPGTDGSNRYPAGVAVSFLLLKGDVLTFSNAATNIIKRVIAN